MLTELKSGIAATLTELRVLLARAQSINFDAVTIDLASQETAEPDEGNLRVYADLPPNVSVISALLLYQGEYDDSYDPLYSDKIKFISINSTADRTRVYVYFKEEISTPETFRVEIKYLTIS